jgi:hypothetical protein
VEVIYEGYENENEITPQINYREFDFNLEHMNRTLGL